MILSEAPEGDPHTLLNLASYLFWGTCSLICVERNCNSYLPHVKTKHRDGNVVGITSCSEVLSSRQKTGLNSCFYSDRLSKEDCYMEPVFFFKTRFFDSRALEIHLKLQPLQFHFSKTVIPNL